jgi:hypothetical protein
VEWDGIHLGRYKGNDLVYAGKVDHGFTPQSEKELHDGFGSKAPFRQSAGYFRSTPNFRHVAAPHEVTRSAKSRHPPFFGPLQSDEAIRSSFVALWIASLRSQ